MSHRRFRILASVATALLLLLGAAACSDDDSGDTGSGNSSEQPSTDDGAELDIEDLTGGSERPFGVEREGLAESLNAALRADRWEIDGDTIRFIFDSGTYDSITAAINCSAALTLQSDDDRVVLVYPDGEVDCDEQS